MRKRRYRGSKPVGAREVVMLATSLTILAAACYAADQAPEPEPELPVMELVIVEPTTEEILVVDPIPDEDEAEQIEAALMCQGYFREDVPLSYDEQDFLHAACDEFSVDYHLMLALIEHESNFRNIAGDGGKSQGYCQIQQKWWGGLMEEIGAEDLTVPRDNFRTSCAILAQLTERYDGDIAKALVAYNQGSYKGTITNYALSILERAEDWREG